MPGSLRSLISHLLKRREMERKGLLQKRRRRDSILGAFAERSRFTAFMMLLLVLCTSVVVLVIPGSQNVASKLIERQVAPATIYATFNYSYEDVERTRAARDAVRSQIPLYYRIDAESTERGVSEARELFQEVRRRVAMERKGLAYIPSSETKTTGIVQRLDKDALSCLMQITENPTQSRNFFDELERILSEGVIRQSDKDSIPWVRQVRVIDSRDRIREPRLLKEILVPSEACLEISNSVLEYYSHQNKGLIKQSLADALSSILSGGNLVYDKAFTEARMKEAAEATKPIMVEIRKGQPIIVKDQEIGRKDLLSLACYEKELEARSSDLNFWRKITESAAICLALMIFTGIYLYHIHPEVVKSNRTIWLLGTATIISLLSNYLVVEAFNIVSSFESIPPALVFEAVPLGFAAIVLSVLYGLRSALYVGLFIATVAALSLDNSFNLVITGLMVSGVSGFAVRYSANYRSYFIRSFLAASLTTLVVGLIFLWKDREAPKVLEWAVALPFITGLLTATMAQIALFFFEYVFDVSTNMSLLLFCDYNHPLLKRLQLEAPGTYHHSLVVSTLAEHAAQEIGANPIRARVGALFHDIGKLSNPEYFSENSGEDKHKELNPRMSSLIILNHVKEGSELAKAYKLKKVIRDAIEQHHGTDLVYFFYKRAQEESGEPVGEQEFKYPGPLPREKEVVIVALADCCEAASRTLQKPSHGKIDSLIWEIFRKKIRDGQLDSADLSFRELAKVRKSFVKTLTTMFHGRVAYPKDEEEDNEDDLFMAADRLSATQTILVEEIDRKGG